MPCLGLTQLFYIQSHVVMNPVYKEVKLQILSQLNVSPSKACSYLYSLFTFKLYLFIGEYDNHSEFLWI